MTTTISAFSSETSGADGGRFTTTYTAFRAREPREAEAGVSRVGCSTVLIGIAYSSVALGGTFFYHRGLFGGHGGG